MPTNCQPSTINWPRPLPTPRTARHRVRRQAEETHAHEPLQRTPGLARPRAQEAGCHRRRLRLERFCRDSGTHGPGKVYDFDEGGWLELDTDEKGLIAEMEKFRKDFDQRILERLLALNLERAAEEEKAAKVKKPKTSRAKKADE